MSTADKWIRGSTIAAVVVVAAVAASFSYQHALDVIGQHSRQTWMNNGFPLTVDGLIFAGSMVLLNDARRGLKAHPLAWFALGLGILATLTVNVVSGLAYGLVGAAVAAWPAVALIMSYELLMVIVRRSAVTEPAASVVHSATPEPPAGLNGHAAEATEKFAAELAAGTVPTLRQIQRQMRIGQPKAQQVQSHLSALAGSNGHGG